MRENRVRSRAALYPSASSLALSCPTPPPAPALLPLEGLAEVMGKNKMWGRLREPSRAPQLFRKVKQAPHLLPTLVMNHSQILDTT